MISCRCQRGIVSGVASDAMSVRSSAEYLAEHGQPPALVVGQFETLSAELLLQDAIVLPEILEGGVSLAGDPAGHGRDEDLPGAENRCHSTMVARSVVDRQLSVFARAR